MKIYKSAHFYAHLEYNPLNIYLRLRCFNKMLQGNMYHTYESNQQHATIQVHLLFIVSSTCFGRCFHPSSGALDCVYSVW